MPGEEPVSRRGFIELSAGALAAVGGGINPQLSAPEQQLAGEGVESPVGLADDVDGAGILLGPVENRPDPDDDYFDQWQTYHFVYVGTGANEGLSWIKHGDPQWRDITMNPQTQIDEVRVEDFASFFNHTFARPNAPDDKNWLYTDADITKSASEIELASTTRLESQQRGNYPPGGEAVPGVAWRVTAAVTGGECFAGYFTQSSNTPDDGFGFGMDADGTFTFIAKNGTIRRVYQGDWNGVDIATDPFRRHYPQITRFPHLFYGGGSISYRIVDHESDPMATKLKTVHVETPVTAAESGSPFDDGPPFEQPNLPVNFVTNGLTGGSLRANAAHYEIGQNQGETRVNGEHFADITVTTSDWTPLISWRKRSSWEMVNVKPLQLSAAATTNDVKLELQLNPTLSDADFALPTHASGDETAVEVDVTNENPTDTTDTSITTDGERRWTGFIAAGQGSKSGGIATNDLAFNLPADEIVTLAAQAEGGEATISGNINWQEFF